MKANAPNQNGNGGDESSVNGEGHSLNILDGDLQLSTSQTENLLG